VSVKVSLQQWDLPLTINISLNGCEWKKLKMLAQNACSRCFLTENEILMGKDKDQHITMRSLTLLIFAAEHCVVDHDPIISYIYILYILLYPRPFRWWKYFCCFICVTSSMGLTHCYKNSLFYIYICSFSTKFTLHGLL